MQTLFAICLQERNIYNNKNTINIISIINMGVSTTCGSGKNYKQCCGK